MYPVPVVSSSFVIVTLVYIKLSECTIKYNYSIQIVNQIRLHKLNESQWTINNRKRGEIILSLKYNFTTCWMKLQLIYLYHIITKSAHMNGHLEGLRYITLRHVWWGCVDVCMCWFIYTYTHIYTYTRIYIYTYIHIYIYTYTHIHIYIYTYTYIHI